MTKTKNLVPPPPFILFLLPHYSNIFRLRIVAYDGFGSEYDGILSSPTSQQVYGVKDETGQLCCFSPTETGQMNEELYDVYDRDLHLVQRPEDLVEPRDYTNLQRENAEAYREDYREFGFDDALTDDSMELSVFSSIDAKIRSLEVFIDKSRGLPFDKENYSLYISKFFCDCDLRALTAEDCAVGWALKLESLRDRGAKNVRCLYKDLTNDEFQGARETNTDQYYELCTSIFKSGMNFACSSASYKTSF